MIVYAALRFLFLLFNYNQYQSFSLVEILSAFLYGLRFDVATICFINLPVVLWAIFAPHSKRWTRTVDYWLFLTLNIPFIILNLVDLEYIKFTGKRMSPDIFFIKEGREQLGQFIWNFWYICLLIICFVLILVFWNRFWKRQEIRRDTFLKRVIWSPLIICLVVLGFRGGWQRKILKPVEAYTAKHFQIGNLRLNSAFTMIHGRLKGGIKKKVTYFNREEVFDYIRRPGQGLSQSFNGDNVVLIILESFSTEFWGAANDYPGYTPFLDSLTSKGLFFKRNFSTSRSSMSALFSLLFAVPNLIDLPLVKSNYQQNKWVGLPHILSSAGYHSSFFHGAKTGVMYFNSIIGMAGFKEYFPLESYPNFEDFDGNWGIYDKPFLLFAAEKMNSQPQPFFSSIFTISSHQPYTVPAGNEGKFPKGTLEIHQTIGYTDNALKHFFAKIEKMPWFKNTLFIITADHTQDSDQEYYANSLGNFMVPLLLYHPGRQLPVVSTDKVIDHTAIFPTVVDYLGLPLKEEERLFFGRSVFENEDDGQALLHMAGTYWLVKNDYFLQYHLGREKALLFDYRDLGQKNSIEGRDKIKKDLLNKLRAYIQYFTNGLVENSLYEWMKR